MSRFNTLLHGEPLAVAEELSDGMADEQELRAAICNAMRYIADLERRLSIQEKDVNE